MIKLIILRYISAIAWKVFHILERTIDRVDDKILEIEYNYQPEKTWMWIYNWIVILVLALIIIGSIYLSYNPNIQDQKPIEKKVEVVVEDKDFRDSSAVFFSWLDDEVYNIIIDKCEKRNIDPSLFMSFIQKETGDYAVNNLEIMKVAISRAWAMGISQILPCHILGWNNYIYIEKMHKNGKPFVFREKTWKNRGEVYMYYCYDILKDPEKNIEYGTSYLKACLLKSRGDITEAARMYNQGTGSKKKDYKNWKYAKGVARLYKKVLTQNVMAVR